jgi:UDP-N-acetylglucosamine/UDP-N-acetylgalactosamine 4-epimerase
VIPLFIDAIVEGVSPVINGDGEQTRDFTFVENVVEANIRALFANEEAVNRVYNVALGENITLNSLFKVLRDLGSSDMAPKYGPDRKGDVRDSLADISLAQKYLGYNPSIKIEKGLAITFDWFVENKEFINIRK